MRTQLKVRELALGYDGRTVVEGINFSANAGDYICIAGANGSGKSTLLKAILGMKKPIGGTIELGMIRNEIGYLPQQDDIQKDFPASVEEVVLSGCANRSLWRPFYTKEEREIAYQNMRKVRVVDLAKTCYRELSGGQQQRVLLARALTAARGMIVLDEPVAGLDPVATEEMYKVIKDINDRDKITIIMVSHDVETALRYASHILYIGKEHFFGKPEQYKSFRAGA